MLLDLWRRGLMPLDRLVSRRVALDEVNDALDDLIAGRGIRTVIVND
jgi:S-(hydroxymethyl)glutathione dehydrogenase/alcohol dehydrogenase